MTKQVTYYGNKKTKVAHKGTQRDACRVAEIKPENRQKFKSRQDVLDQGYRWCKACATDE